MMRMNKSELLAKMRAGRESFEAELARLSEKQLTEKLLSNGWTGKDVLAHIAAWEIWAASLYPILVRGGNPERTNTDAEVDVANRQFYYVFHNKALAEIQQMEHNAYKALLTITENMAEDDLISPERFAWSQGQPLSDIFASNSYEHYDEHQPMLQELAQQG